MSERQSEEAKTSQPAPGEMARTFLVVVDESPELEVALRYACRRARHTRGKVALLIVLEPSAFRNWLAVDDLMREEARKEAEQLLQRYAAQVQAQGGGLPVLYLREGDRRDELLKLLDEEPSLSVLVLGANVGQGGPGPLVSALTGKFIGRLRVPLTIVPGSLSTAEVDALA